MMEWTISMLEPILYYGWDSYSYVVLPQPRYY
jgi:hypothetical protein